MEWQYAVRDQRDEVRDYRDWAAKGLTERRQAKCFARLYCTR
jgi:hypothetical protein